MDFYEIQHDKKKGLFYKAVHKVNGKYVSSWDNEFEYKIGEIAECKRELNTDPEEDCGSGIHIAHLAWCLDYAKNWEDICILECEAKLDNIIVPVNAPGKVRTDKVKIVREVPLEECGLYGKIIAKRIGA